MAQEHLRLRLNLRISGSKLMDLRADFVRTAFSIGLADNRGLAAAVLLNEVSLEFLLGDPDLQ